MRLDSGLNSQPSGFHRLTLPVELYPIFKYYSSKAQCNASLMNIEVGVSYRGRGSVEPPAPNAYGNYILYIKLI